MGGGGVWQNSTIHVYLKNYTWNAVQEGGGGGGGGGSKSGENCPRGLWMVPNLFDDPSYPEFKKPI